MALAPAPLSTGPPPPPPPDVAAFCADLAPAEPRNRALLRLVRLIAAMDPSAPLRDRLDLVEDVARWVREGGRVPPVASVGDEHPRTIRLRLLVRVLEDVPGWRRTFARVLRSVLWECSAVRLFCKTGLPNEPGLIGEAVDRLIRPILPAPPDDHELDEVVARMFPTRSDALWLRQVPPDLVARVAQVLRGSRGEGVSVWEPLRGALADAVALLATRVSALGLSYDIRVRGPEVPLRESPFFLLPRVCDALLATCDGEGSADPPATIAAATRCKEVTSGCRSAAALVEKNLEQYGVSVDVVYTLELMTKSLDRLDLLISLLEPDQGSEAYRLGADLLATLLLGHLHDISVLELVRDNVRLLAVKIIERVGETGEHYITASRAEYRKMLLSASGGGVLTAGTAALKFLISWIKLAPFIEGLFASVNYAGSFVLMQILGFTLATKQPSMTAAVLAQTLQASDAESADEVVTLIARITRSQLAAAIGNVGMVIPSAIALDWLVRNRTGHSLLGFFDPGTAEYVLHSLHPLQSGTIFYAIFTGGLLWLSSVAAGWLENWAVYRRLPEAIAQHRIRRFVGSGVTAWAARTFRHNIAGFGGNVSLGLLLGMTAVSAKFFGVPLDVRHVTLSTGALVFACCELGQGVLHEPKFLAAAVGIVIIGLSNFGVSFALAFAVALRARQVTWPARLRLVAAVFGRMIRSPLAFVFPPRDDRPQKIHR